MTEEKMFDAIMRIGSWNDIDKKFRFHERKFDATKIDFIYMVDENDNWSFYYENGTCLTDEEKTELENWFITCGQIW